MSNIIIPRKELYVASKMHLGMQGLFRLKTINKFSGKNRIDTGWFPNTILDAGRNIMATRNDWMTYCQVGTDGVFPTLLADRQTETALGSWHAGTNTLTPEGATWGQAGTSPYYGWKRKTWRFAEGTVAANLSEAAVGWAAGPGSSIICRAPILDPILHTPTTITPLIDELLDVMYELRYYVPLVDVVGPQVTLNGVIYDTLTRAANATGNQWSEFIGSQMGYDGPIGEWIAYTGDIGTIIQSPSGTSAGNHTDGSLSNVGYSDNSYEVGMNCNVPSLGWNINGIRSIRIHTTAGAYQTQFNANPGDATIPKTSAYTMFMTWTMGWAEYIAPWAAGTYSLGDRVTHNGFSWESDINNNTSEPGVADWTLF